MVFWKHPGQCLAGNRCPSEPVCFLPQRRADPSTGAKFPFLPLSFLLFLKCAPSPLEEGFLWSLTLGKLCCSAYGNSQRFLPEGQGMLPLEWGLSLPFWLSGPTAPALSCHLGEVWSPQVGEEKHSHPGPSWTAPSHPSGEEKHSA